jgi:hypothetical protein
VPPGRYEASIALSFSDMSAAANGARPITIDVVCDTGNRQIAEKKFAPTGIERESFAIEFSLDHDVSETPELEIRLSSDGTLDFAIENVTVRRASAEASEIPQRIPQQAEVPAGFGNAPRAPDADTALDSHSSIANSWRCAETVSPPKSS